MLIHSHTSLESIGVNAAFRFLWFFKILFLHLQGRPLSLHYWRILAWMQPLDFGDFLILKFFKIMFLCIFRVEHWACVNTTVHCWKVLAWMQPLNFGEFLGALRVNHWACVNTAIHCWRVLAWMQPLDFDVFCCCFFFLGGGGGGHLQGRPLGLRYWRVLAWMQPLDFGDLFNLIFCAPSG